MTNDQFRFLKKLEGNVSDHIRRALEDYIGELKRKSLNISISKSKGGEYDTKGT